MKKHYSSPELEIVRFSLKDVILSSPTDSVVYETRNDTGEFDEGEIGLG